MMFLLLNNYGLGVNLVTKLFFFCYFYFSTMAQLPTKSLDYFFFFFFSFLLL